MKIIFTLLLLTIISRFSYSQDLTSSGKEFYFAFPPNYHTLIHDDDDEARLSDSLYVFIAANEATTGYIETNDIFGNSKTFNFEITNPNEIYIFKQSFWDYEMISYDFDGYADRFLADPGHPMFGLNHNEDVTKISWHLVSEKDVNITILNQATKSSDATLLFPVKSLGKDYIVASYYPHIDISNDVIDDTPSQFVIVGSEDNTGILIYPSTSTQKLGNQPQSVILNKGETYLVQSKIDNPGDLTGTIIEADKNIVVIGSQLRAKVPVIGNGSSRDCLLSQLLPTDKWGKSAFSIPFVKKYQWISTGGDVTRIIASEDNSEIFINGTLFTTIDKGDFYDLEDEVPMNIESNNPIAVVQYKKSFEHKNGSTINRGDSDPFMAIIPPREQFLKSYKIMNVNSIEVLTNGKNPDYYLWTRELKKRITFEEHYLNVFIHKDYTNTLRLNGNVLNSINWQNIPTTGWQYAQIKVNAGTNIVEADTTFGIVSYGYGVANSYGYVGGLGLKSLYTTKPEISANSDCYKIEGQITSPVLVDENSLSIELLENNNIDLQYGFDNNSKVINYTAELVDIYQDGDFTLKVTDPEGLTTEKQFFIQGFTFSISEQNEKVIDELKIPNNTKFCKSYYIKNYSKYDKTLENITLEGDFAEFEVNFDTPAVFKPDEEKEIEICFDAVDKIDEFELLISLNNKCADEERINLILDVKPDESQPEIEAVLNDCERDIFLTITEKNDFDFGIKEFRVIDSLNVFVQNMNKEPMFDELYLKLDVIDPYQDAYINIEIEDEAGLISKYEKYIPGHTLDFADDGNKGAEIDFGNIVKNKSGCLLLPIYNYGNYPITYYNYNLLGNVEFSIPFSQFPIIIHPNDTNFIEICLNSNNLGVREDDTLTLNALCIDTKIPLNGFIIREVLESNSKCDLKLILSEKVEFEGIGDIFPNPLQNDLNIEVASLYEGDFNYYILDLQGNILEQNTIKIAQGVFILNIDVSFLINGNYNLVLEFEGQRISRKFVVEK